MEFDTGSIAALQKFKAKETFRMDAEGRFAEMKVLVVDLAAVFNIPTPGLEMEDIDGSFSGDSEWNVEGYKIIMRGKLSIITFLHEFYHGVIIQNPYTKFLELDSIRASFVGHMATEKLAQAWAIHIFSTVYPRQWAKICGIDPDEQIDQADQADQAASDAFFDPEPDPID